MVAGVLIVVFGFDWWCGSAVVAGCSAGGSGFGVVFRAGVAVGCDVLACEPCGVGAMRAPGRLFREGFLRDLRDLAVIIGIMMALYVLLQEVLG